jgi:hypothetical protein
MKRNGRAKRRMRRLCRELISDVRLDRLNPPVEPTLLFDALCAGMSRLRGRPVRYRMAAFPPGTASGLWLDMAHQDLIIIEERTAPDHQLVILGHELWHMAAGHCGEHIDGAEVAARLLTEDADLRATVQKVAARTRFDRDDESQAESFGLLLGSRCRAWLPGGPARAPLSLDDPAGRIEASLGYRGQQH